MKLAIYGYVPDELVLNRLSQPYETLGFQVEGGHVFCGVILEAYDEDSSIFFDELPVATEAQKVEVDKRLLRVAEILGLGPLIATHCFLG